MLSSTIADGKVKVTHKHGTNGEGEVMMKGIQNSVAIQWWTIQVHLHCKYIVIVGQTIWLFSSSFCQNVSLTSILADSYWK